LLEFPHVLPLFFGRHFVVDGGRVGGGCPFFFVGFLFGELGALFEALGGGEEEGEYG
jgi:hypothetical protein